MFYFTCDRSFTLATVGLGTSRNSISLGWRWGGVGWGGVGGVSRRNEPVLNVWYCLENAFLSCTLCLYVWLGFRRLRRHSTPGAMTLYSAGGRNPQTLRAHPTSKLWLRYCRRLLAFLVVFRCWLFAFYVCVYVNCGKYKKRSSAVAEGPARRSCHLKM